ncbi:cell division protein PerM [Actinomadura macrotermitis]|uniref:cell division protein PerM n=1 Tax=Actinomadura macrotermitis TaxID=2585200 RepID=UPI002E258ED9
MSDDTRGQRATTGPARPAPRPTGPQRPLYVSGLVGALWCVGIGLAVLVTITLAGWIAAPRTALGHGLPGVFRTAVNFWLVSHHAGFSYGGGRIGLLPLGLLVLPGVLLHRSGGWIIRSAGAARSSRRGVLHVAIALAVPYAALAGLLALAASSPRVKPSAWQALLTCFLVAAIAGGLGAARALVASRGRVRSGLGALLRLLPPRAGSLVIGVTGALAVLLGSGAILVGASLALHMSEATRQYDMLAPGIVGTVLLLVVELAYLPNAVIWGASYAIGPGFAVGAGSSVSATGVFLDSVPVFPPLAALPDPGPAPALSLVALAAPFLAGIIGGTLTMRALPTRGYEIAPLWGFATGALTGGVAAVLAALSGGPLGGARMATVGPSAWQVGLLAALEVGISAALAAWLTNWRIQRRPEAPPARPVPPRAPAPAPAPAPRTQPKQTGPYTPPLMEFEEAEPILTPRRQARRRPRPQEEARAETAEPETEATPEAPEPEEVRELTEPLPAEAPAPNGDGPTENRGGAIYVLRNDPRD